MGFQQTNTFSRSTFIILHLKIAKANTLHLPVEGSAVQSWGILTNLQGLRRHSHLVWNKRGLTIPARTLGSWEAMTSVIISGNSTCMASAWMKVLRQYRLIFFTICHTRDISGLFVMQLRLDHDMIQTCERAYIVHGIHQFGEVVEPLGAGHQAFLLHVDGFGQLPDVVLSHFFKHSLTFESLERHCEHRTLFKQ